MSWQNPKTDWINNPKNPMAVDFNRIESNIAFLKQEIETKKALIVNALNSVGISASMSDTHEHIATKIGQAEKTGITILPSTNTQAIPKGIYNTSGGIVQGDENLVSGNIRGGVSIFGVSGNSHVVNTSDANAVAQDIKSGKTAYVGGNKVTGTLTGVTLTGSTDLLHHVGDGPWSGWGQDASYTNLIAAVKANGTGTIRLRASVAKWSGGGGTNGTLRAKINGIVVWSIYGSTFQSYDTFTSENFNISINDVVSFYVGSSDSDIWGRAANISIRGTSSIFVPA